MKGDVFRDVQYLKNALRNFNDLVWGYFKSDSLFVDYDEEVSGCRTWYCYTPRYQSFLQIFKNFSVLLKYLNVEKMPTRDINEIEDIVSKLDNPDWTRKKSNVTQAMTRMELIFITFEDEIKKSINYLGNFEKERLSEAIHTYLEGCYDSTVAMSVCAIESRLFRLMSGVKPDKKKYFEELTLGKLIGDYRKNRDEYARLIPELKKHEELLSLFNRYRIPAVHPKNEKINKRTAESILNLTFEFLLDRTLEVGD